MSEKHYPFIGGAFDRIIFDGDGSVWIKERTCENDSMSDLKFECSRCGESFRKPQLVEINYCPNCGAKVEEE